MIRQRLHGAVAAGAWSCMRSVNWRLSAVVALMSAALIPAGLTPVAAHAQTPRATGALLAAAAHHPNSSFNLIVQQRGAGAQDAVRRSGGTVTGVLSLIHSFTANVPGRAVRSLAANNSVNWLSLNGPVRKSSYTCCSASGLQETYTQSVNAAGVWGTYKGTGVGVAVVDSGINTNLPDFKNASGASRVVAQVKFSSTTASQADKYGHGTHVAGIVAGNGSQSNGAYVGIAPDANLINVKVSDDTGMASVSDVVNGLQWVYNNRSAYNIRVVNLSLNSTVADSYQVDPLDAAVETLWKAGIVVVASAGNAGSSSSGVLYAPANDPFVITVGAVNENGTPATSDDTLASFSSYGTVSGVSTLNGGTTTVTKPELVAPGVNIISDLASGGTTLAQKHSSNVVGGSFFSMSGTSMAAPMVSGAAALLLQSNPNLTPDQVKARLIETASPVASSAGVGAGELNVAAAIAGSSTDSANSDLQVAASLLPGNPAASWGSVSWGSVSWGSTDWSSASWGSVSWGSASWGSASWGTASWGSDYWGS